MVVIEFSSFDSILLIQTLKLVNYSWCLLNRALVSMGAVGAIVLMVFPSVAASTHGFWFILSKINHFSKEKIRKPLVK